MRTLAPTIAPPTPLAWAFDPVEGVARWPGDRRLAALVSGVGGRWSRWSLLAAPAYSETISSPNAHALTTLRRALDTPPTARGEGFPPLAPGRVVTLSYELGRAFEASSMTRPGVAPLAEVHECPGAAVYDHAQRRWWLVGDPAHVPDLAAEAPATHTASVGTFVSASGRGGYTDAVRTALAYIGAGDVYQVNLAHRLRASFQGTARSLFAQAARAMAPWYGAYVESAVGGAALSFSPELFLSYDNASRRVVTRPIKGTRAANAPPDELRASVKDQAELAMIVDLMRNDLGRVCAFGSAACAATSPRTCATPTAPAPPSRSATARGGGSGA